MTIYQHMRQPRIFAYRAWDLKRRFTGLRLSQDTALIHLGLQFSISKMAPFMDRQRRQWPGMVPPQEWRMRRPIATAAPEGQ